MRFYKTIFTSIIILISTLTGVAYSNQIDTLKKSVWQKIDNKTELLENVNKKIWSFAEIGLEETESSNLLIDVLTKNGFSVKKDIANMPTAFMARYGKGKTKIGILAEYDALPGVSQSHNPFEEPGPNKKAGHACGHSVFGVGSLAAALAIKELIEEKKIDGTITLYGTPAEETGIGKVYMLKDNYFKDEDVIFSWHPFDQTAVSYNETKALVNVKFVFKGTAAHSSVSPWRGKSALDAVELMTNGVNFMREHIKPDARIHYIITKGGDQPNVVPPEAEVWFYIRANKFSDVENYFIWVKDIAEAAAKMSRTKLDDIIIQSEVHEKISFRYLSELMQENLEAIGPPIWSEEELEFARVTQRNFLSKETYLQIKDLPALYNKINPLRQDPYPATASTDIADISWFVPTGGVGIASYGYNIPIHSWPVVAATGTTIGTKALIVAAKTIAATSIDLYENEKLLNKVKSSWKESRGDAPFKTLIPKKQMAPERIN